jgi:NADH-quinone oxidoreductase subunit C
MAQRSATFHQEGRPAGAGQQTETQTMSLSAEQVAARLNEKFGGRILETDLKALDPFCRVEPQAILDVASFCRDDLGFNYLACLTGVDYLDKKKTTSDLGVVYHLQCIPDAKQRFCLKVRLPREAATLPTVENVWRTADWHEREAWDMYGIVFEGHHNLTRILCAEDWEGHPLRKDYASPETYHGIKNNVV